MNGERRVEILKGQWEQWKRKSAQRNDSQYTMTKQEEEESCPGRPAMNTDGWRTTDGKRWIRQDNKR